MPRVIPNAFTTLEFSPEEEEEARTIPPLFKLYLISLRSEIAHTKIAMKFDPQHQLEFMQNEAALAGKLDLLNQLIGD